MTACLSKPCKISALAAPFHTQRETEPQSPGHVHTCAHVHTRRVRAHSHMHTALAPPLGQRERITPGRSLEHMPSQSTAH